MGWPYAFRPRAWADIDSQFAAFAAKHPGFAHMSAIVVSVRSSKAEDRLAAFTSMRDLMVVARPIPEPPYDLVAIRAPSSLHPPVSGSVLIEHLSVTGRNDRVERPVSESVPLFWRFMIEKFGVEPIRDFGRH